MRNSLSFAPVLVAILLATCANCHGQNLVLPSGIAGESVREYSLPDSTVETMSSSNASSIEAAQGANWIVLASLTMAFGIGVTLTLLTFLQKRRQSSAPPASIFNAS